MIHLAAFLAYVRFVILDGDYRNDFLSHLPAIARPFVEAFGYLLARIFGS